MRTRLVAGVALWLTSFAALSACEGSPSEGGGGAAGTGGSPSVEDTCADLGRAAGWHPGETATITAESSSERIAEVGDATWALAFDLFGAVPVSEVPNLANSPASFYTALGLAYGRWQGAQCGDRIATVLRFPETGNDIHESIGASVKALGSRSLPAEGEADPVLLSFMQSRWVFETDEAPPLTELDSYYGSTSHALVDSGDAARQLMNCVVEYQSNGLLVDFLPPGAIQGDTASYDLNVTYLKAPWRNEFSVGSVDFTAESGATSSVPGIGSAYLSTRYFEGSNFDAIHLPLRGDQLFVMVVLPRPDVTDGLEDFTLALSLDELSAARDTASVDSFRFAMPQIDIAPTTIDFYERLGFDCDEFTMRKVFHAAAVAMDDKGIEAAAATAVEGWDDGGGEEPNRDFEVNRPFLFFVYDVETRFLTFAGRWLGPSD